MPRTAHLLPPYDVAPAPPFMPDVDAMLTMSPCRLRLHQRHDAVGDVDQTEDVGLEHRAHRVDVERADFAAVRVGRRC